MVDNEFFTSEDFAFQLKTQQNRNDPPDRGPEDD